MCLFSPFLVLGEGVSRMHIYRLEDERFVGGGSWDHGVDERLFGMKLQVERGAG